MKVPDSKLYRTMILLRSLSSSNLGELAENCGTALAEIGGPAAATISIQPPGLEEEKYASGSKANLSILGNILKDFGAGKSTKDRKIANSIMIITDDNKTVAISFFKYLGNYAGHIAAIGEESAENYLPISEAVWLCCSQIANRMQLLMAPGSPAADELIARRILSEAGSTGITGLCVISTGENEEWLSLTIRENKILKRLVEKSHIARLTEMDDGELIDESLSRIFWPGTEIPTGFWMTIRPGHYLAIGLEDRKLITSGTIGKVREAIENAAIRDTEYLAKSFDKLKADFKKMVKSERAAAITETAVTINHEINNPLTAILGNTQLLLMSKEKLPPEVVAKLETIERSAIKIRETTSKLMAIIEPVTTAYASGLDMIDIEKSKKKKSH